MGTVAAVLRYGSIHNLAGLAGLSIGISATFVEVAGRVTPGRGSLAVAAVFALFILWVTCGVFPAVVVVSTLVHAFREHPRGEHLAVILVSYVVTIVTFAGLYYVMSFVADYNDAVDKYFLLSEQASLESVHVLDPSQLTVIGDQRAFSGIAARFYSGVDWPGSRRIRWPTSDRQDEQVEYLWRASGWATTLPLSYEIAVAERPFEQVVQFQGDSRFDVAGDCLHFSITTMTTVGYGDITPTAWYSRLASDLQMLLSSVLLVVAFGLVAGNWWAGRTPPPASP